MSGAIHFLLVEDDPAQARLMQEMLRHGASLPAEVQQADRLSTAVTMLEAGGIDMVLLDLGLPDSQGIDTFRRLRKAAPHVPVIVLSGVDDEEVAVRTVQEGAEDYLVKGQLGHHSLLRAVRYAVERSRATQAMRDFDLTVRAFLAIMPDSVIMVDPAGTILDLNRNAARRCGAAVERLAGKCLYDVLPPDLAALQKSKVEHAVQSGEPASVVVHSDGRWYEHSFYPVMVEKMRVGRLVVYSRDITPFKQVEQDLEQRVAERTIELKNANVALQSQIEERTKLEDDLREAEERYRILFEQGANAILLIDPADGGLVEFNSRACEYLGYTPEEFSKVKIADIEADASEREVLAHLQKMLESAPPFETRHRTKGGELRSILMHARPVSIRGQLLINAICTDITDRKRMENQLRDAIARLEEHDRAKSDFVSNVSHDLKTPLASMSYALENLQKGIVGRVDPRVGGYLTMLYDDVQRLTRTVEDILDLSRLEAGRLAIARVRVPFARLARRTTESIRIQARAHRLRLRISIDDSLGFVECDPHKMVRLILNVLNNAIKFTPPDGRLEVRTRRDDEWPGFLILDVIDTGVGIDPQYLRRVTERYFRVGEQISGTGIGLTICKEILELHGGRIDLKSPPPGQPRGTQVTIGLPRVAPPRLLLFNRDRAVLKSVTGTLTRHGYLVSPFDGGPAAWTALGQEPAPDAVVIDLAPGDTESMELLIRARTLPDKTAIPIVITIPEPLDDTRGRMIETLRVPVVKKNGDAGDIMDALEDELMVRQHMAALEKPTPEVDDETACQETHPAGR